MADAVEFELVSPERLLLSGPVEMVVVPGSEGDFGVLPGHAPVISAVRPGVIETYESNKVDKRIFVAGGFAEVTGERCTVLAEEAVAVDEIDLDAVKERLESAENELNAAESDADIASATAKIDVAQAMMAAVDSGPAH